MTRLRLTDRRTRRPSARHPRTCSLDYLNNRHYDPTTGTFVSVDPLVGKTMQPYIYGAANPVTYSDPSGLDPDTASVTRHRSYDDCILTLDCSNENLADSIAKTPNRLGGAVFSMWDAANQGWLPDADGNLDQSDLNAAASGQNIGLLGVWLAAGDPVVGELLASIAQAAAVRLQGSRGLWESLDTDLSFVQRNSTAIGAGSFVLAVASLGTCAACTYAGYASLAGSAATTGDACLGGRNVECGAGLASFGLPVLGYETKMLARAVGTSSRTGRLARLQNWTSMSLDTAAYHQFMLGTVVSGGVFAGDSNGWSWVSQ